MVRYGPGHRLRVITKAVGDRGGIRHHGAGLGPDHSSPWPVTDERSGLHAAGSGRLPRTVRASIHASGCPQPPVSQARPWSSPRIAFTVANSTRSHVRFWEQNGSGGTLPGAVRSGHRARPNPSDLLGRRTAAGLPPSALSSHRGGQGFKSPQLHANPQVSALTCGHVLLR